MLEIAIPESEFFDEKSNMFFTVKPQVLQLEHSLISVSRWESKWKKPFLTNEKKTTEEYIDYIKCMTINKNVNPLVYGVLSTDILQQIDDYVDDNHTATWFNDAGKSSSREIITSEIIYYWMFSQGIPIECERWHLGRLMTLLRVFSIKNGPQKKMSKAEILSQNARLNAERKARMKTRG